MKKAIVRFAHGGHLSAVIERVRRNFTPRHSIIADKKIPYRVGRYTFLAPGYSVYADIFAIIRSLETGERPVLLRFSMNESWFAQSELFEAYHVAEPKGHFIPFRLTWDELEHLSAPDRHSLMGNSRGGVIIGKLPRRTLVSAQIGDPSSDTEPRLKELLESFHDEERTAQLFEYLVNCSLIEGEDGTANRLLRQFEQTKKMYTSKQFREEFCGRKL